MRYKCASPTMADVFLAHENNKQDYSNRKDNEAGGGNGAFQEKTSVSVPSCQTASHDTHHFINV